MTVLTLPFHSPGSFLLNKLNVHVVERLNPSATNIQETKRVAKLIPLEDFINSASKMIKPTAPMNEPVARVILSWIVLPTKILARRRGKVVAPPMAIRFPDLNGEYPSDDCEEAAKMGMLASHEPRIKKQVIANQDIVIITPHWLGPRTNSSLSSISWSKGVGGERRAEEGFADC